jgi:hypothetical protein
MHKQGKLWSLWLVPVMGGLVVLSVGYIAVGRGPSNAREELSISLGELRSQAAEAGLLAERGSHGDLTRTFVRNHARQVEKHMRAAVEEVHKKGSPARQPAISEQAEKLGEAALASLQRLAAAPDSPATLRDVSATMASTTQELSRLDSTLQQPPR